MNRISKLGDKYQLLIGGNNDKPETNYYYEKDNPDVILPISDNPEVVDYVKQYKDIYKKGGLANQYANLAKNQRELY